MMRSASAHLRLFLLAAIVPVTASCGSFSAGTGVPGGSATPTANAPSAASSAGSASPTARGSSTGSGAVPTGSAGPSALIYGVIQAGPTCPADPVYHACRPRRLGHVEVQARSSGGAVMASTRTQSDGHYSLHVRPGSYVLVIMTTSLFPRCPRSPVSIGPGAVIHTNINCDTGIRQPMLSAANPP